MIKGYGEKIDNFYKNLREENLKLYKKRHAHIEKICPKIINIEKKIAFLSLNILKNISTQNIKYTKEEIHELRIKKSEMLVSLNFPINYLDLIYNCEKCKDTGYITTNKCICFNQTLSYIYLQESDLNTLIKTNNFDNFDLSLYSENKLSNEAESPLDNIKKIYYNSMNYIKTFNDIDKNLLFIGSCGSGKTFLSHCIAKELLEKSFLVIYKTSNDLISDIQSYYSFNSNKNSSIDNSLIMQCDLLIIDDLGAETCTQIQHAQFFNFLNKKLLLKKKLLISTNLSTKELKDFYRERIFSRLLGNFSLYKFYVDQDIRIKKRLIKK